jgi:hypothetical protein
VSFFSGPILDIGPAVVCENVFSDTPRKNVSISGMDEFDIASAKPMMPPMKVD